MRKRATLLFSCLILLGASSLALAAPIKELGRDAPARYLPRWDGRLASVELADGGSLTVWSYRNGAEYDLALAFRDADGSWAPTSYLGVGDGNDQLDPQVIADPAGHLYLSWVDRQGRLSLAIHSAVGTGWSPAAVIAEGGRLGAPAMQIVGGRLVVAFRDGAGVGLVDLPLLDTLVAQGAFGLSGLHDVPDPVTSENPYDNGQNRDDDDSPFVDCDDEESPYEISPNGG